MSPEYTELIASIAVGVLTAIFISAFIILILICKRQRLYYKAEFCENRDDFITRPEAMLIEPEKSDADHSDFSLNPKIEQVLADEQWVDDVSGLIPHCLAILKTCRFLTERLTTIAMGPISSGNTGLRQIITSAKKISSHVDDMVRSMYPPLDPRLLEARATALTLAVSQLAVIARYECGGKGKTYMWIDKTLYEMDQHMAVLREASMSHDLLPKMHIKMTPSYDFSIKV